MAVILDPSDEAAVNGAPHEAQPSKLSSAGEAAVRPSRAFGNGDFWTADAPKRLRKGIDDASEAWDAWWTKRQPRATLARLVHAEGTPLVWGLNAGSLTEECRALVELAADLDRGAAASKFAKGKRRGALEEAVAMWLEAARDGDTHVSFGIGCLAAAHVLHRLGLQLGAEQGWPLIDFLHATAEDARPWSVDAHHSAGTVLAQQLVAGELPLTLSYLFPEAASFVALRRGSRTRLAEGIDALCGDSGLVRAGHVDALRPLIACWTRSQTIGAHIAKGAWPRDVHDQFRAAVRQAVRWTDSAGRPLLASADCPAWAADFLAAALRSGGRRSDAAAARVLLAGRDAASETPATKRQPPRPATFSESANLALLRTSWAPHAPMLAIDYSGIGMRLAATAVGSLLFDGMWTASSHIDGRLLKPSGPWEAVCWFTDKDVDYIELALDLDFGARLERQVLLARTDGFLFLADHLQNSSAAVLEHTWQLPLADELACRCEDETRDAVLTGKHDVARLLPLALPEWRIDARVGELTHDNGVLRLDQRAHARAMACPLFVDLKPRRIGKPCTWRQLAVAEALQVQPADVAVGYRVQCGRKQWVFYRSQAPRGNRTVLGQNTSSEFLAARFLSPSGEIEELIQVEG